MDVHGYPLKSIDMLGLVYLYVIRNLVLNRALLIAVLVTFLVDVEFHCSRKVAKNSNFDGSGFRSAALHQHRMGRLNPSVLKGLLRFSFYMYQFSF